MPPYSMFGFGNAIPPQRPTFNTQNRDENMLMNLGFNKEQALEALILHPANVNDAAAYLLDKYSQVVKPEPKPKKHFDVFITATIPPVFKKLYQKTNTCDVTFYVGENKVPFRAHKYILAMFSSVFDTMFFSDIEMAESIESPILKDVDPEDFENFLKYCYLGILPWDELGASLNLYTFADKYMVERLKVHLVKPIKELIGKDNVITVYYYSRESAFSVFKTITESYICKHAKEVFGVPNLFNKIDKSLIIDLMKLNLNISQRVILERVIERVLNGIPESERTKERLKELRVQEADILSAIKLDKLDKEGLEIANRSKLFKKKDILNVALKCNHPNIPA